MKPLLISLTLCALSAGAQSYNQSVRAVDVVREFRQNQVAAAAKYAGHVVSIGGVIAGVGMEKNGSPYVLLEASDHGAQRNRHGAAFNENAYLDTIKCNFPIAFNGPIARLRPGSSTAFHGLIVAQADGHVAVQNCSFP